MLYRGTSFEKSVYMHVHKTSKASKPNPTLSSLRSSSGPVYISNWIDTFPIQTYRGFSIKYKKFKSKVKQLDVLNDDSTGFMQAAAWNNPVLLNENNFFYFASPKGFSGKQPLKFQYFLYKPTPKHNGKRFILFCHWPQPDLYILHNIDSYYVLTLFVHKFLTWWSMNVLQWIHQ